MQEGLDFILRHSNDYDDKDILEIGCSVGRCIGTLASRYKYARCWGIDYSYQMLKQAKAVWIDSGEVAIGAPNFGFLDEIKLAGSSLTNLSLGLAKCEDLPFADDSQDLVISSFLVDRLSDPIQGLKEMKRVLRPKV